MGKNKSSTYSKLNNDLANKVKSLIKQLDSQKLINYNLKLKIKNIKNINQSENSKLMIK